MNNSGHEQNVDSMFDLDIRVSAPRIYDHDQALRSMIIRGGSEAIVDIDQGNWNCIQPKNKEK